MDHLADCTFCTITLSAVNVCVIIHFIGSCHLSNPIRCCNGEAGGLHQVKDFNRKHVTESLLPTHTTGDCDCPIQRPGHRLEQVDNVQWHYRAPRAVGYLFHLLKDPYNHIRRLRTLCMEKGKVIYKSSWNKTQRY